MSTFLSRLTLVSGFPPLLAAFTILVLIPLRIVARKQTWQLVYCDDPSGMYSSKSSRLCPLPPLLP